VVYKPAIARTFSTVWSGRCLGRRRGTLAGTAPAAGRLQARRCRWHHVFARPYQCADAPAFVRLLRLGARRRRTGCDPLALLEALRRYGDRFTIFCQSGRSNCLAKYPTAGYFPGTLRLRVKRPTRMAFFTQKYGRCASLPTTARFGIAFLPQSQPDVRSLLGHCCRSRWRTHGPLECHRGKSPLAIS